MYTKQSIYGLVRKSQVSIISVVLPINSSTPPRLSVKVVRKFELSAQQVSLSLYMSTPLSLILMFPTHTSTRGRLTTSIWTMSSKRSRARQRYYHSIPHLSSPINGCCWLTLDISFCSVQIFWKVCQKCPILNVVININRGPQRYRSCVVSTIHLSSSFSRSLNPLNTIS